MLKEFKEFAIRGNMVDLAIGVMIGAVFGAVVSSLVDDIFSPLLGLLVAADFKDTFAVLKPGATNAGPYTTLASAKEAGAVVMSYGVFINAVIKFLLTSFVLFLVVKGMNKMKKEQPAAPAEPPADVALLTEIRDLLKKS